ITPVRKIGASGASGVWVIKGTWVGDAEDSRWSTRHTPSAPCSLRVLWRGAVWLLRSPGGDRGIPSTRRWPRGERVLPVAWDKPRALLGPLFDTNQRERRTAHLA